VLDHGRLRWEQHGEFISYTFSVTPAAKPVWPAALQPPGLLLVSVDLRLVGRISHTQQVHASIVGGQAIVCSNFSPNPDGFVDITLANRGMTDELAGATAQRLLEIETYRCLALLGLPLAEQAAAAMTAIEHQLPMLMEKMSEASSLQHNRELLDRLTAMSVELERNSTATHFRFGATRAYAELVRLRLDALAEQFEDGKTGLASFFSRRFDPAIRTCVTTSEREANLARKLTRAAQLLRTRVEIGLESQNRDLLQKMSDRVQHQLRLQQAVEGLSVAAIAYYVTSLLHQLATGARAAGDALNPDVVTSIMVVPVVILVAIGSRHLRRRNEKDVL
jgi:uncharacterized membrane-anchored protein